MLPLLFVAFGGYLALTRPAVAVSVAPDAVAGTVVAGSEAAGSVVAGSEAPDGPTVPLAPDGPAGVPVAAAVGTDGAGAGASGGASDGASDGAGRAAPPEKRSWWEGIDTRRAGRLAAAVGALGILLIGVAPMAAAAANGTADPQIAEATDGVPTVTDGPAPGFRLTDVEGRTVSLADLRGSTVVLTFLDPVCTTDCPIIAQELKVTNALLGADAGRVRFVAVVANPVYRSQADMAAFDRQEGLDTQANWTYLTGSLAALRSVWNTYGVTVLTAPAGGMVAHADVVYVIDAGGHLRRILDADPGSATSTARSSFSGLLATADRRGAAGDRTGVTRRTWLVVGAVLAALVVGVVALAVASSSSDSSSGSSEGPAAALPPPAATTVPTGTDVVLAMGHLDDPANTFAELIDRTAGSTAWKLATPPGVADNGGLVVGASTAGTLTAGFLPSADLTFSVLAQRPSGVTTWSPADVPGALAPEPDALATGTDDQVAAVLVRPAAAVVAAGPGLATWTRLATAPGLGAASSCRVDRITAVAYPTSGAPILGTGCSGSSTVGLFATGGGGRWTLVGPVSVPGAPTSTRVVRLAAGADGLVALVEATGDRGTSLAAVWVGAGTSGAAGVATGTVAVSVPLPLPAGWSLRATSVGGGADGRGATVLLGARSGRGLRIEGTDAPAGGSAGTWSPASPPPTGTTAVAAVGTETDAFVPSGSHLTVWTTSSGVPGWTRAAGLAVPIQYGSSS